MQLLFFPLHFHFLTFLYTKLAKRATHSATSYIFSTRGPEEIPACLSKLKYIYITAFTASQLALDPQSKSVACWPKTTEAAVNISFQRGCRWDGDGEKGGWVRFFFYSSVFLDGDVVTLSQAKEFPVTEERSASCWRNPVCLCRASKLMSAKNPKEQHI